jgi:hypothetical protein
VSSLGEINRIPPTWRFGKSARSGIFRPHRVVFRIHSITDILAGPQIHIPRLATQLPEL